jgi:glutamine cyclotransferase
VFKNLLPFIIILCMLSPLSCAKPVKPAIPASPASPLSSSPAVTPAPAVARNYSYRVLNSYPHDSGAFTQGLVFDRGMLFEGTGLMGRSSLRRVDLETGRVLQIYKLADDLFGEGIALLGSRIYQLTWQNHTGFVYNLDSFEVISNFSYDMEGWGLATDGKRFIMSDGTPTLYFLDPASLKVTGTVQVADGETPVKNINELEYIDGYIYANIWMTERIAIISPATGKVAGWIDLAGLREMLNTASPVDVLNGIAYDAQNKRLFVTGKLWPKLYQIELVPVSTPAPLVP